MWSNFTIWLEIESELHPFLINVVYNNMWVLSMKMMHVRHSILATGVQNRTPGLGALPRPGSSGDEQTKHALSMKPRATQMWESLQACMPQVKLRIRTASRSSSPRSQPSIVGVALAACNIAPSPLENRRQVLRGAGARRQGSLPGNPIVAELVRFESAIQASLIRCYEDKPPTGSTGCTSWTKIGLGTMPRSQD
jgi:hypothetical protein